MPLLILLISLCLPLPAWAGDLEWAGAISGAGQGMSRGLEQMQSAMIQSALQQQRFEYERQREERQYQREAQQQERQYARELAQIKSERAAITAEDAAIDDSVRRITQQRQELRAMKESAPSVTVPDAWLSRARVKNPDVPDAELIAYYVQKYTNAYYEASVEQLDHDIEAHNARVDQLNAVKAAYRARWGLPKQVSR